MNSRRVILVLLALVAVAAVGGIALYSTFLAGDNVPALGLDTPAPSGAVALSPAPASASALAPASTAAGATGSASPAAAGTSVPAGELAGTWTVASGVAGYRVRETFLQQNAESDAVGRSTGVTGTFTVAGSPGGLSLTAGRVNVDMTALTSDRPQRDGQVRRRGPETDTFPTSTFELSGPVALQANFGSADVAMTLPGKLTLHGVTKDVDVAAQTRLEADGTVVVAGSLPILFSDYGMEAPNVAGLIAVQDNGSMEFRIVLAKG
jgi:polyisoprenoid-binding protein YceI